jgi:predicted HNH restriction endonuclease
MPQPKIKKRTYADRAEYIKAAVSKRRKKVRLMAIEYGGGSCRICGYQKCNRALSFHHKDPSKKDFGLSAQGLTRAWAKTKSELDKCILVCANCHMEIHEGLIVIK